MRYFLGLFTLACLFVITACDQTKNPVEEEPAQISEATKAVPMHTPTPTPIPLSLRSVLDRQDDAHRARYDYRHPEQTLTFFDVQPNQTVMEFLPGGGWYTKILLSYLGQEGALIGIDYSLAMWAHFPFADDAFLNTRSEWANSWKKDTADWSIENAASVSAYAVDAASKVKAGSVDRVLFIRALHNFHRFSKHDDYIGEALALAHRVLTPTGTVGVVQHRADESKADDWADGSRGYLKQSHVIALFEQHGFSLVKASEINANPLDKPGDDDIVWRLPPSYYTSKDNPGLKKELETIGESDRMTLLFKKSES